jgi:hypothetical protein
MTTWTDWKVVLVQATVRFLLFFAFDWPASAISGSETEDPMQESEPATTAPLMEHFQLLKRRWLMLLIYCVVVLEITTFQFTYASFQNTALAYFEVGTFELNLMVNIVYLLFVPFSFVASWLMDQYVLKRETLRETE